METATATPPPATAAAPAAAASAPSPKSPVPPGSPAAHMENAKKFFAPDPSKSAPVAAEGAKPVAEAAVAEAPVVLKTTAAPKAEAAAKPAEAAPVDFPEDKLPEPTTEAAKAGWKELKAMTKAERNRATVAENRIKELEAKQVSAPANSADTAELERLRTEHKSLSDRLLTLDLQNHPDFHRQYSVPKKAALDTAMEVISYNGKEAPAIEALLSKPLKDFNAGVSELTKDMNPADASTVMQSLRQARDISSKEAAALGQAGEVHKQLQQQAQHAQRTAFEAVHKETVEIFKKQEIKPEMSPEQKTMAEEYNRSIDGLRAQAESRAFGKITEREVASMAFESAQFQHMVKHAIPVLNNHIASQAEIISQLKSQLESLRGGKAPNPGGATPPAGEQAPANESHEIRAKRVWGKA